jgi:hypothetical protein
VAQRVCGCTPTSPAASAVRANAFLTFLTGWQSNSMTAERESQASPAARMGKQAGRDRRGRLPLLRLAVPIAFR